jgi:hypothetical protein
MHMSTSMLLARRYNFIFATSFSWSIRATSVVPGTSWRRFRRMAWNEWHVRARLYAARSGRCEVMWSATSTGQFPCQTVSY